MFIVVQARFVITLSLSNLAIIRLGLDDGMICVTIWSYSVRAWSQSVGTRKWEIVGCDFLEILENENQYIYF